MPGRSSRPPTFAASRPSANLAQVLKQHDGVKKLTLTPAYKVAIDAYQKFINDNPASIHVDSAAEAIFSIAAVFEQHQAYDVAADIYKGFVTFAAQRKPLTAAAGGSTSFAERAEFAAINALDAKARAALTKALADRKPDAPPPAKLSDEFAAAINGYKAFVKAHPASPMVGTAIQKIMAIALEYARVDAWDVADAIYGDLAGANLPLLHAERLEFARASARSARPCPTTPSRS